MSDEQMQSVLDEWFEDTDPQPPDAHRTTTHVMARVPQTRQRGRWLPFRLFRPKAQTPTATDTTEYQPSPIPATNGHTPTVIGRTTSMFSPVKAITAGAIVFAVGGAFLIAQPFDQQGSVPGAEVDEATTEPSTPAIVTGNMVSWGEVVQEATETEVSGVRQRRGLAFEGARFEMDDPRLTGDVSYVTNGDGRTVGDAEAVLFTVGWRIENDEGSWSGSCPSFQVVERMADPSMADPLIYSCLYTGAGAYEGLSAYLQKELFAGELPYPVKGLIFEGDLPPTPEMSPAE